MIKKYKDYIILLGIFLLILFSSSINRFLSMFDNNLNIDSINNNLEDMLTEQIRSIENLDKYINNWEKAYENKDLEEMKKEFKKLETEINKVVPLENTIKSARRIENLHNLIVSKGGDFYLTQEELSLAEKLV